MMTPMGRVGITGFDRQALSRLRRAAGMTQEDLAIIVGVDGSAVSSWEQGRTVPSPQSLDALRAALRDTEGQLVGELDPLRALAQCRARAGLSQKQAAVATGLTPHAVRQIERGVRLPTTDEAAAIGAAYGISTADVQRHADALHQHRKAGRSGQTRSRRASSRPPRAPSAAHP
ncbi:MAG: helix-turn-helix domain-containing protein [Cumulibacter sp.]